MVKWREKVTSNNRGFIASLRSMNFQLVNQPYPFYYENERLPKLSLTIGFITALFLFLFEPVGIELGLAHSLLISCSTYGLVAGVLFYIYLRLFPRLLPEVFNPDNWTIAKEALMFSGLFMLAGLLNFVLRPLLYQEAFIGDVDMLVTDITNTFLVGFLVSGILTLVNFRYLFQNQEEKAELLGLFLKKKPASDVRTEKEEPNQIVQVESKNESFTLDVRTIRYIKADGNYVSICSHGSSRSDGELKRITLKELETLLDKFPHIMRVHRAYMINLNEVAEISGNAQGYQLKVKDTDEQVPVSRTYLKAFNEALSAG